MNFNKLLWLSIGIILIGFASYFVLVVYGLTFGIKAEDMEQLAHFAAYQNYFLAVVNMMLVGLISYLVYNSSDTFNKYQMSPILDFRVLVENQNDDWYLVNCSNAVARNICIKFATIGGDTKWIVCYSLSGNNEIQLPWLKFASKIEVVYADPFLKTYIWFDYFDLRLQNQRTLTSSEIENINKKWVNSVELTKTYVGRFKGVHQVTKPSFKDFIEPFLAENQSF